MNLFITPSDIITASIMLIAFLVILVFGLKDSWRQARCKHNSGVNEDQKCDAWCRACGKNLGFIGALKNRGNPT